MTAVPPHVYTLTGNLLAETTLDFDTWQTGGTHRAHAESFQVGGKGINVSKMLNRLGVANTAIFFAGGITGNTCRQWLATRGFSTRCFETTTATRSGVVVRAAGQKETTFLGPDRPVDPAAILACAEYLDAQPRGHVLALCGSFPGWEDSRFEPLRDALARWLSRGCLVADTYGPPLRWIAAQPVELLKINARELATLGSEPGVRSPVAALRYVITDGPNPLRVRDVLGAESFVSPPAVTEVSATGSGDVLLACLLQALFVHRKSLHEAVQYGLPFAAANAAHPGVAEFPGLVPDFPK